jgi:hypothetical protein
MITNLPVNAHVHAPESKPNSNRFQRNQPSILLGLTITTKLVGTSLRTKNGDFSVSVNLSIRGSLGDEINTEGIC